jgi:hypothetical protein
MKSKSFQQVAVPEARISVSEKIFFHIQKTDF